VDIAGTRRPPGAADVVAELYAEHALGLVRLAVVLTGDRGSAEDVVQDAFLGLYRRWDQLRDTSEPLGYLRVSVVNGCRTALRRRSRLDRTVPFADGSDRVIEESAAAESPEDRALLNEEQRAVAAALGNLPRLQREVLTLRYYLDMSEEEIAQTLHIARGTVKSAKHRALAAIGRTLKREGS
jgi:RNA polymerase sigma-70 factor (sigma-E family)